MRVFFVADTHFGDKNIMLYENRPFQTVEEMNRVLVENWNATVQEDDIVYHLGDVGDVSYIKQLHGIKYLVKGNHDTLDNDTYRNMGFTEIYDMPVIYENFWILSHEPMYINQNMPYANLFGHVHNNPIYHTASAQSYCVSVERISYKPISFEQIRKSVTGDGKTVENF